MNIYNDVNKVLSVISKALLAKILTIKFYEYWQLEEKNVPIQIGGTIAQVSREKDNVKGFEREIRY